MQIKTQECNVPHQKMYVHFLIANRPQNHPRITPKKRIFKNDPSLDVSKFKHLVLETHRLASCCVIRDCKVKWVKTIVCAGGKFLLPLMLRKSLVTGYPVMLCMIKSAVWSRNLMSTEIIWIATRTFKNILCAKYCVLFYIFSVRICCLVYFLFWCWQGEIREIFALQW